MTKHQQALKFAHEHLGEHEQPPGSNTGPFVRQCQASTWLAGTRWPWCASFIVKAWTVAGFKFPYRGASAFGMLDYYRAHLPRWVVPVSKAKPGAAVVFNVGSGHVAMLEVPYAGTEPYVQTIGGNEGDAVRREKRHISLVRGVVDPVETGTPPTAKPPIFEVVTSASGHAKLVYASNARAVGKKLPQLLNRYGGLTIRRRHRT